MGTLVSGLTPVDMISCPHPGLPHLLDLGSPDPEVRLKGAHHLLRQLAKPGQLEQFCAHRVNPLLYQLLIGFRREELGNIPHFQELRQSYIRALRYYTHQKREIRRLLEVLAQAEVEVILLKGADVRHRLYEDPAVRLMDDVDILVAPEKVHQVRAALTRHAYFLRPMDLDLQPRFQERFGWVISFDSPSRGLLVDVHWEIREAGTLYRLPYGPLRQRAQFLSLAGQPALVLAPEHLLMHLCLHAFDEWDTGTMLKVVDLDLTLRLLPINWNLFLEEASTFGLLGPLSLVLGAMEHLRPGAVPEEVLGRMAAYRPGLAESFVLRRGKMALGVASLLAVWRYLPLKAWPSYIKGKVWPSSAYLKANSRDFANRRAYLRHLWRRSKART